MSVLVAIPVALVGLLVLAKVDVRRQSLTRLTAVMALGQLWTALTMLAVFDELEVYWPEYIAGLLKALALFSFDLRVIKIQCLLGADIVRNVSTPPLPRFKMH